MRKRTIPGKAGHGHPPGREEVMAVSRTVVRMIQASLKDLRFTVFLFGSWVTGDAVETSDIDIGIEGPLPVRPEVMQALREACERLPTLYTVDLVDFAYVSPEMRKRVLRRRLDRGKA